jgi:hypothetical protein
MNWIVRIGIVLQDIRQFFLLGVESYLNHCKLRRF